MFGGSPASQELIGHQKSWTLTCSEILTGTLVGFFLARAVGLSSWARNYTVDAALEGFFLQEKAVFVPDKVRYLGVELVTLHTPLKQTVDVLVVRVSSEGESSAVVHVLLEFWRLVETELVHSDFLLLALDVVIFFVL